MYESRQSNATDSTLVYMMPEGTRKRNVNQQKGKAKAGNGVDEQRQRRPGQRAEQRKPSQSGWQRTAIKATFACLALVCLVLAAWPLVTGESSLDLLVRLSSGAGQSHYQHFEHEPVAPPQRRPPPPSRPPRPSPEEPAGVVPSHMEPNLRLDLPSRSVPAQIIRSADREKRDAVKDAFASSWAAYVEDAFGTDEYNPISRSGHNFSHDGAVGYFVVDVIDVLMLMNDREGYVKARDYIRGLDWKDKSGRFNVFETTIRTLGGLLSAHALCTTNVRTESICDDGDAELFLAKAVEVAEALRPAFEAYDNGLPHREIDFATGETFPDVDNNGYVSLAEATTSQLEFKYLAHVTGDEQWWRLAEGPMKVIREAGRLTKSTGLMPIFIDPLRSMPVLSEIRLGSRGDSYYEYLLKQFVQSNKTETVYLDMYQKAMLGVKLHLLRQTPNQKLLFVGELSPQFNHQTRSPTVFYNPKQDHLVCFLGGSFMLGALHVQQGEEPYRSASALPYPPSKASFEDRSQWSLLAREDWKVGHELIRACVETYTSTKTGLSPEIAMFRVEDDLYPGPEKDWYIKKAPQQLNKHQSARHARIKPLIDARNILRPETVESLFIAFHLTGDQVYRDWGWTIFEAFQRHTRLGKDGSGNRRAYAGITDVNAEPGQVEHIDRMETFWLAETLKYLYLLFADQELIRLDQWVMNTEAHPLPIFTPNFDTDVY